MYKDWILHAGRQLKLLKELLYYIGKHNQDGHNRDTEHKKCLWEAYGEI
jgi:hypothetical protein